jgi:hypothetical protein
LWAEILQKFVVKELFFCHGLHRFSQIWFKKSVLISEIGWTHGARHAVAPGFGLKKSVLISEIGWTHGARHAVAPGFGLKKSVLISEIGWTHGARHAVAPGFGLKKIRAHL